MIIDDATFKNGYDIGQGVMSGLPYTPEDVARAKEEEDEVKYLYGLSNKMTGSPVLGSVLWNAKAGLQRAFATTLGKVPYVSDFVNFVYGGAENTSPESWHRILNHASQVAAEEGTPFSRFLGGAVQGAVTYAPIIAAGRFMKMTPFRLAGVAGLYSMNDAYTSGRASGLSAEHAAKYAASVGLVDAATFGLSPYIIRGFIGPVGGAISRGGVGPINISRLPMSMLRAMHNAGGSILVRNASRIAAESAIGISEATLSNGVMGATRQLLDNAYGIGEGSGINWEAVAESALSGALMGVPWGRVTASANFLREGSDGGSFYQKVYGTKTPTIAAHMLGKATRKGMSPEQIKDLMSEVAPKYKDWDRELSREQESLIQATREAVANLDPEMNSESFKRAAQFADSIRIAAEDLQNGITNPYADNLGGRAKVQGYGDRVTDALGVSSSAIMDEYLPLERKLMQVAKAKGYDYDRLTKEIEQDWEEFLPVLDDGKTGPDTSSFRYGLWSKAEHNKIAYTNSEHKDHGKIAKANRYIGYDTDKESTTFKYSKQYRTMYEDDNFGSIYLPKKYNPEDVIYVTAPKGLGLYETWRPSENVYNYVEYLRRTGGDASVEKFAKDFPETYAAYEYVMKGDPAVNIKGGSEVSVADMILHAMETSRQPNGQMAKFITGTYKSKEKNEKSSNADLHRLLIGNGYKAITRENGAITWAHKDDPTVAPRYRVSGDSRTGFEKADNQTRERELIGYLPPGDNAEYDASTFTRPNRQVIKRYESAMHRLSDMSGAEWRTTEDAKSINRYANGYREYLSEDDLRTARRTGLSYPEDTIGYDKQAHDEIIYNKVESDSNVARAALASIRSFIRDGFGTDDYHPALLEIGRHANNPEGATLSDIVSGGQKLLAKLNEKKGDYTPEDRKIISMALRASQWSELDIQHGRRFKKDEWVPEHLKEEVGDTSVWQTGSRRAKQVNIPDKTKTIIEVSNNEYQNPFENAENRATTGVVLRYARWVLGIGEGGKDIVNDVDRRIVRKHIEEGLFDGSHITYLPFMGNHAPAGPNHGKVIEILANNKFLLRLDPEKGYEKLKSIFSKDYADSLPKEIPREPRPQRVKTEAEKKLEGLLPDTAARGVKRAQSFLNLYSKGAEKTGMLKNLPGEMHIDPGDAIRYAKYLLNNHSELLYNIRYLATYLHANKTKLPREFSKIDEYFSEVPEEMRELLHGIAEVWGTKQHFKIGEAIDFILGEDVSTAPVDAKKYSGVKKVISGGQTGGDLGALKGAKKAGVETGGTAPPGFLSGLKKEKALLESFGMKEGEPDPKVFPKRSMKNVDDSDGTVAIIWGKSTGTSNTIGYAKTGEWRHTDNVSSDIGKKPLLVLTTKDPSVAATEIADFVTRNNIETLNVAGHRESTQPGIEAFTEDAVIRALKAVNEKVNKPEENKYDTIRGADTSPQKDRMERDLSIAYELLEVTAIDKNRSKLIIDKDDSKRRALRATRGGLDQSKQDPQTLIMRSIAEMAAEGNPVFLDTVSEWAAKNHGLERNTKNFKAIETALDKYTLEPINRGSFLNEIKKWVESQKGVIIDDAEFSAFTKEYIKELGDGVYIPNDKIQDAVLFVTNWLEANKDFYFTAKERERFWDISKTYRPGEAFGITEEGKVVGNLEALKSYLDPIQLSSVRGANYAKLPNKNADLREFKQSLEDNPRRALNDMSRLAKECGIDVVASFKPDPDYLGKIKMVNGRPTITLNSILPHGYVLGYRTLATDKSYVEVRNDFAQRYMLDPNDIEYVNLNRSGNRFAVVMRTANPNEVVARIMAHEIGHWSRTFGADPKSKSNLQNIFGDVFKEALPFVDAATLAPKEVKGFMKLAKKFMENGDTRETAILKAGKKMSVISDSVLRAEGIILSKKWMPLAKYNHSEIMANVVSAAILDPMLVKKLAPSWHKILSEGHITLETGVLGSKVRQSLPLVINKIRAELAVASYSHLEDFEMLMSAHKKYVEQRRSVVEEGVKNEFPHDGTIKGKVSAYSASAWDSAKRFFRDIRANLSRADAHILTLEKDYTKLNPNVKLSELPSVAWEEYRYLSAKNQQYENDVAYEIITRMKGATNLKVDDLDTIAALNRIAKGDRSELLNPGFMTKDGAVDALKEMKKRLGDADFKRADDILSWYQVHRQKLINEIEGFGVYSEDAIATMKNNPHYYRFSATKYVDRQFKHMKQQIGNTEGIAGAFFETVYYDAMHRGAVEKQSVKNKLARVLEATGEGEWVPETYKNMKGESPLLTMEDGKIRYFATPSKYTKFISNRPNEVSSFMSMIEAVTAIPKIIWTQTPAFALPNLMREIQGGWIRSELSPWEIVRSLVATLPDVWADVRGKTTPLVRKMHEEGLVVAHRQQRMVTPDTSEDIRRDATRFIRQMNGLTTWQDRMHDAYRGFTAISAYSELMMKYAGADAYMRRGESLTDPRIKHEIRLNIGQPDVTLGGHMKRAMNSIFMFSPAGVRGWASLADAGAKRPKATALKYTLMAFAPVLAKYAAYQGWFGKDAEDTIKSMPEYMVKNYNPFPIGKSKSGGFYVGTIPIDYSVLPVSNFLWDALPKTNKNLPGGKVPGKSLMGAFTGGVMSALPIEDSSINPIYRAAMDMASYVRTGNVYDSWREAYVIPPNQVGTPAANFTYTKYLWNTFAGNIIRMEDMSELFMLPPGDSDDGTVYELMGYIPAGGPALRRMVRYVAPGGRAGNEERQIRTLNTEGVNIRRYATRQWVTKWIHEAGLVKRGAIQAGGEEGLLVAKEAHAQAKRDMKIGSAVMSEKYGEKEWLKLMQAQAGS